MVQSPLQFAAVYLLLCLLGPFQSAASSSQPNQAAYIPSPTAVSTVQERVHPTAPQPAPQPVPQPASQPTPAPETLYVLMYHEIIPDDAPSHNDWMITISRLREDLTWLRDHGYTTVLPSELAAGQLPPKPVLITFDDGYASNYTLGLPLFRELGVKCEVALITHHMVDGTPGFLTWEMCREMAASGLVEFGTHTHNLHTMSPDPNGPQGIRRIPGESQTDYQLRLSADLQTSISMIQTHVGTTPTLMAHPFGFTDPWADPILAKYFPITVTSASGGAPLSKGLQALPRYNITIERPVSSILP